MQTPEENKEENYYKVLGRPIQEFLINRWSTQTKAAKVLRVSRGQISNMISGKRPPSKRIMLTLEQYGFDKIHFERWFKVEDIAPDNLTKKDYIMIIADQRIVIESLREVIRIYQKKL